MDIQNNFAELKNFTTKFFDLVFHQKMGEQIYVSMQNDINLDPKTVIEDLNVQSTVVESVSFLLSIAVHDAITQQVSLGIEETNARKEVGKAVFEAAIQQREVHSSHTFLGNGQLFQPESLSSASRSEVAYAALEGIKDFCLEQKLLDESDILKMQQGRLAHYTQSLQQTLTR